MQANGALTNVLGVKGCNGFVKGRFQFPNEYFQGFCLKNAGYFSATFLSASLSNLKLPVHLNNSLHIPQTSRFNHVIQAVWQIERRTPLHKEIIVPKGMVEIIFNLNDHSPILSQIGSRQYRVSDCFINGFNTVPIQLQPPEQQVFFGVQLQPLAVKEIFGTPASEFSNTLVDVTLLDATFRSLWHQLAEQSNFEARVSTFLGWLERRFPEREPRERLMNDFLGGARYHDLTVTALASSLYYSPRHLSRKITEATGMNTEEMLLYKKYLHAVNLIHQSDLTLTEIAHESHFSDQSHFIKSFRAFTGMTPGTYKRTKSDVKGHIFEDVR